MAKIDALMAPMRRLDASDLHMSVGSPPKYRIQGDMTAVKMPVLTEEAMAAYMREIVQDWQWEAFVKEGDLDFSYGIPKVARFRCNYFMQRFGMAAVFRIIPERIETLDEIGAPDVLKRFCHREYGLVLVTGPTGSGKSTTLAGMINYINENFAKHILTVEDPIEFVHENKKSLISQREVHHHTHSFAQALRSAMREDPNIVLVGEMRDLETIALALTCAETGVLVFGTLHTNSAGKTVDRIIDVFPAEQQPQVRTMLANSLAGIISQQLLRTVDKSGRGRVAGHEVLVGGPALGNYIRTGQISKIESIIQAGGGQGMQSMDACVRELFETGVIGGEEAYMKSFDKRPYEKFFEQMMERQMTGAIEPEAGEAPVS